MCDDTTRHNMMQGTRHWRSQVKLEPLPGHAACCMLQSGALQSDDNI